VATTGGFGPASIGQTRVPPTSSTPPTDAHRGPLRRAQWLDLGAAGLTVGLFLAIQLALLLGPHPFDPAKYFSTAVHFPNVGADLWTLRIGLVAPAVVAVRLIGANEAALYAVPLAVGVLLVTAVYGTMLALFRDRVLAAAAALVAALNTDFLLNSSFLFPDTAATATFATGFLFLVLGGLHARSSNPWIPRGAVLAAGFFFGWTYLIRDFSPILIPTVVVAALVLRYPWRRLGLLAAAAVTTGMLEFVYGALQYGEPFVHLDKLFAHRDAAFTPQRALTIENVQRQTENPIGALLVLPRIILSWDSGWFLIVLAPIFVAALVLLRDRRLWILAAWSLWFWVVMVAFALGELPSGRWIINVTNVRYWYPIFPALAMSGLGGLWLLVRRYSPPRRGLLAAQLAVLALAALILLPGVAEFRSCTPENLWRNDPVGRWHELRSWLATDKSSSYDRIMTDRITARQMDPVYVSALAGERIWEGSVKPWPRSGEQIEPTDEVETTMILLNRRRSTSLSDSSAKLNALTAQWTPVFVSGDGALVLLAHRQAAADEAALPLPWWKRSDERSKPSWGCGVNPFANTPDEAPTP
jgi:hypothetical protein